MSEYQMTEAGWQPWRPQVPNIDWHDVAWQMRKFRYMPAAFHEGENNYSGDIIFESWLDHWVGEHPVWQLSFYTGGFPPKAGDSAYSVPLSIVRYRMPGLDVPGMPRGYFDPMTPFRIPNHYFTKSGLVTLTPEMMTNGMTPLASTPNPRASYRFDATMLADFAPTDTHEWWGYATTAPGVFYTDPGALSKGKGYTDKALYFR